MGMHRTQRFSHPSLRSDAFRTAQDVAAPRYKPHPLGPSDVDRLTLVAAGTRQNINAIPILDTSIRRLNASLASMNMEGWRNRIKSIDEAQRKADDIRRDLLAGRV